MGMRPRLNVRATRNYISQCDHRIDESPGLTPRRAESPAAAPRTRHTTKPHARASRVGSPDAEVPRIASCGPHLMLTSCAQPLRSRLTRTRILHRYTHSDRVWQCSRHSASFLPLSARAFFHSKSLAAASACLLASALPPLALPPLLPSSNWLPTTLSTKMRA